MLLHLPGENFHTCDGNHGMSLIPTKDNLAIATAIAIACIDIA